MVQENNQPLTKKEMEDLLSQQTIVILDAVDKKLADIDLRISQKIEHLTTTLDRFLKRLTDMEDEFTIMKHDIARVKQVISEKLGVDLS